ncbi:MAG: hypothetical protein KC933_20210 [Myxococcales bacterium]|nr:hypothetical protein [Myxococcales bacterium]
MTWRVLALTVGLSVLGGTAWAGDHADTPYLAVDGSVDLTDLYAWTTTSTATGEHTLNLAMTIRSHPAPDAVYTFHLEAREAMGVAGLDSDVTCVFANNLSVRCWAGTADYVEGNAHQQGGLLGLEGKMRVWTGYVVEPDFANLVGVRALVGGLRSVSAANKDLAGCPRLSAQERADLIDALTFDAEDDLAGGEVYALVVALEPTILTQGRPVVGVWASVRGK